MFWFWVFFLGGGFFLFGWGFSTGARSCYCVSKGEECMVQNSTGSVLYWATRVKSLAPDHSQHLPSPTTTTPSTHAVDTTPAVLEIDASGIWKSAFDSGAFASDAVDGHVATFANWSVVKDYLSRHTVSNGVVGVAYAARDKAGNVATVVRQVSIIDQTKPSITIEAPNSRTDRFVLEARCNEAPGGIAINASAYDIVDRSLTSQINIQGENPGTGKQKLTYTVQDRAGNAADTVDVFVIVRDTTPPHIELLPVGFDERGNITYDHCDAFVCTRTMPGANHTTQNHTEWNYGVQWKDPGLLVTDNLDPAYRYPLFDGAPAPTAGRGVQINGEVDTEATLGTSFELIYRTKDVGGNNAKQAIRHVRIVDTLPPEMILTGGATLQVVSLHAFVEPGVSVMDLHDAPTRNAAVVQMAATGIAPMKQLPMVVYRELILNPNLNTTSFWAADHPSSKALNFSKSSGNAAAYRYTVSDTAGNIATSIRIVIVSADAMTASTESSTLPAGATAAIVVAVFLFFALGAVMCYQRTQKRQNYSLGGTVGLGGNTVLLQITNPVFKPTRQSEYENVFANADADLEYQNFTPGFGRDQNLHQAPDVATVVFQAGYFYAVPFDIASLDTPAAELDAARRQLDGADSGDFLATRSAEGLALVSFVSAGNRIHHLLVSSSARVDGTEPQISITKTMPTEDVANLKFRDVVNSALALLSLWHEQAFVPFAQATVDIYNTDEDNSMSPDALLEAAADDNSTLTEILPTKVADTPETIAAYEPMEPRGFGFPGKSLVSSLEADSTIAKPVYSVRLREQHGVYAAPTADSYDGVLTTAPTAADDTNGDGTSITTPAYSVRLREEHDVYVSMAVSYDGVLTTAPTAADDTNLNTAPTYAQVDYNAMGGFSNADSDYHDTITSVAHVTPPLPPQGGVAFIIGTPGYDVGCGIENNQPHMAGGAGVHELSVKASVAVGTELPNRGCYIFGRMHGVFILRRGVHGGDNLLVDSILCPIDTRKCST